MVTAPHVLMSVNASVDTTTWEFGRTLLGALVAIDPRMEPDRASTRERDGLKVASISEVQKFWSQNSVVQVSGSPPVTYPSNCYWSRSRPVRFRGHISHRKTAGQKTLPAKINLEIACRSDVDYVAIFKALCSISGAYFGMLHLFTDHELGYAPFGSPLADFKLGPVEHVVRKWIPEMAWGTFLSNEKLAGMVVDIDALKALGCIVIPEDRGTWIFLSDSIHLIMQDYNAFDGRRRAAKRQFGAGTFAPDEALLCNPSV